MTKNKKVFISVFFLTIAFSLVQLLDGAIKYAGIFGLGVLAVAFLAWVLREGLKFNATLVLLVLPVFFSVGSGLFWLLLPGNIYLKVLVVLSYAVGMYAIFKTQNIFSVAVLRRIPLTRAARGIGFALTLATCSFIFGTIYSFRKEVWVDFASTFLVSLPLFIQGFWTVELTPNITWKNLTWSLVAAFSLSQVSLLLFFWPVSVFVASLFLTLCVYVILGLGQLELEDRLFAQNVREYLGVGIVVFIVIFLFGARWGG